MELQNIKSNNFQENEDLIDLYPFSAVSREGKMLCYITCIPKCLYPLQVLKSVLSFDMILEQILMLSGVSAIIQYTKNKLILILSIVFIVMNFVLIQYSCLLYGKWLLWFHEETLKKRLMIWLIIRTIMFGALFVPGVIVSSFLFCECNRLFGDIHKPSYELIEDILALFVTFGLTGLMGYFCLMGWFAKNAVDKMYNDFEYYKKKINNNRKKPRKLAQNEQLKSSASFNNIMYRNPDN